VAACENPQLLQPGHGSLKQKQKQQREQQRAAAAAVGDLLTSSSGLAASTLRVLM
jgi:hypothetical protein